LPNLLKDEIPSLEKGGRERDDGTAAGFRDVQTGRINPRSNVLLITRSHDICSGYWSGGIRLSDKQITALLKYITFLDERLRVEEEEDYLQRITTRPEEYAQENYIEKRYQLKQAELGINNQCQQVKHPINNLTFGCGGTLPCAPVTRGNFTVRTVTLSLFFLFSSMILSADSVSSVSLLKFRRTLIKKLIFTLFSLFISPFDGYTRSNMTSSFPKDPVFQYILHMFALRYSRILLYRFPFQFPAGFAA
jgi:hypothetical protein